MQTKQAKHILRIFALTAFSMLLSCGAKVETKAEQVSLVQENSDYKVRLHNLQISALSCEILVHVRGVSTSAPYALMGNAVAIGQLKKAKDALALLLPKLQEQTPLQAFLLELLPKSSASGALQEHMPQLKKVVDQVEELLSFQELLLALPDARKRVSIESSELLEAAQATQLLMVRSGRAPIQNIVAMGTVAMLSQRINASALEFHNFVEHISPEAVFLFGRDLNAVKALLDGLLEGDTYLNLKRTQDTKVRERLNAAQKITQSIRDVASKSFLTPLKELVAAHETYADILAEISTIDNALLRQCDKR
jgi:twitching motility protein PilJ